MNLAGVFVGERGLEDIENVETVFKDGVGYDAAKLTESARGMVGIR